MKKNNVKVLSVSTIRTVVLSTVVMALMSVLLMTSISFAESIGNEFGGPGIGLSESAWDGSQGNRIYGYGNVNGITGDEVVAHKALSSDGPTNYQVYNDTNPINPYLINMGPTSANNDAYSLLSINDGGPGMGVESNALGQAQYYNDGGPGMAIIQQQIDHNLNSGSAGPVANDGLSTVTGYTNTEFVYNGYVDKGPIGFDIIPDPRNYNILINMKPGDFSFIGSSKEAKLVK